MNNQNLGCVIQTRISSSRLPGKVLIKLDKTSTILDYVVDQLSCCKFLDRLIIATTDQPSDDQIVEFSKNRNLDYFRGSTSDVLDRYYQCAKNFSLKNIVRITSDCPLLDPEIVDQVIEKFLSNNFDYVTNKLPIESPTCNQGTEVEIFSFTTLEKIWEKSKKPSEREHVTPYIYKNPSEFKILNVEKTSSGSLRYTIDREKDLELVRFIVSKIEHRPILTKDIESLYHHKPKLFEINSKYVRNEGYLKSLSDE